MSEPSCYIVGVDTWFGQVTRVAVWFPDGADRDTCWRTDPRIAKYRARITAYNEGRSGSLCAAVYYWNPFPTGFVMIVTWCDRSSGDNAK